MKKVMLLAVVLLAACAKDKAPVPGQVEGLDGSTASGAAEPPKVDEPDHFVEILKHESLAEALNYAKPFMSDTQNETSVGANLFAYWAAKKGLSWTELNSLGETKFSLVKKDSEVYRGQRICRSGRVIQISVERFEKSKVYHGLLMTNDGDLASFIAVKSTGELVERSWAKFCGVVIGNYQYSNSGGGTSYAVQLVGMFDLPENKL